MSERPLVSYGVIADCQSAKADDESGIIRGSKIPFWNCYRLSPQKLEEAVETFIDYKQENGLDFVVHLGDFYDRNMDDAGELKQKLARVGVRVAHLWGNHEWTDPRATRESLLQLYEMPSSYYSFSEGGTRFIMLDTNELGPLEQKKGTHEWRMGHALIEKMRREGAINAYPWNGGLSERQLEWFDNELRDAENHDEWAMPMSHHQIFPPNSLTALNSNEIMDVINAHDNVKVFLNGHNHGGAFGVTRENVTYYTLPGMLSGDTNAFGISEVYKDRFELHGFGRVLSATVEFPISS